MADRRTPLVALTDRLGQAAVQSRGSLTVREIAFLSQVNLRLAATDLPAASAALGIALPLVPNTTARSDSGDGEGVCVLWLGPEEWLVVSGPGTTDGILARLDGLPGSTVDVSAQRTTIAVGGVAAHEVLTHGCALDLDRDLGVGRCAQTMLGRAQVVLWRRDPDEFRMLVRSSFAGYLATWLLDAATEHLYHDPVGGDVTTGCAAMDRTPSIRA